VGKKDGALADVVRNGSTGEHVLMIVKELRNTVHGQALSGEGKIPIVGDRAMEPLARMPQRSRDEVLDALEQLGGLEAWGVGKPFDGDDLYIHPGTFVEQLLPRTLEVFRDLMSTVPVENLRKDNAEQDRLAELRPLSPQDTRTLLQLGLTAP
jgi:hypothetical protein